MINGILNIYKEAGFTSHDVVAKLRGICGQKKIGHTGTLDPDAVGVLPVCLGNATKLCDMLTDKSKEYEAVLLLGKVTDTQDLSGHVLEEHAVEVTAEQTGEAVLSFLGGYEQIPPMYSALKVNGRKLYELARAGKEVERAARRVEITALEIVEMKLPEITLRVECSRGTYIRTLCHDIGRKLGCGGTMKSLKRTRVGEFRAEDAIRLQEAERLAWEGRLQERLIPVEAMFSCPRLILLPEAEKMAENGNFLLPSAFFTDDGGPVPAGGKEEKTGGRMKEPPADGRVRICSSSGRFYGIYVWMEEKGHYAPVKMFL